MTLRKELTCPAAGCTCCCIPSISYFGADGQPLGSADVPCYIC